MNTQQPMRKKKKKKKRASSALPLLRLLAAAALMVGIVLLCVASTRLMPNYEPTPEPVITPEPTDTPVPTPVPQPTITPTPAVYAPFGAQYGHGGEELIPETPEPAFTPSPTPTKAPTSEPETPETGYKTLRKGATGDKVQRMQQALIDLGYLNDVADGAFGANTENAVTMFQAVNSLTADGVAGNMTLSLLYSGNALDASHTPEMNYLILVNRDHRIDKGYVPTDLVTIDSVIPASVLKVKYSGTRANRTAVEALYRMLQAALADGVGNWQVSSAYRTMNDQQQLVDQSVSTYLKNNPGWSRDRALSATYNTVAPAGTSEHHTGLSFDITVPGATFKGTDQQKWLHAHCVEYGFVVRFTESKQKLTGFLAEDWHIRYVGEEVARMLDKNNWCLEEYYTHMGL